MSKVFFGDRVYEVSTKTEAYKAMETIARQVRGTFEGCPNSETGYHVDQNHPINIGGKSLYPILGAMDDTRYGETDDKDLFTR